MTNFFIDDIETGWDGRIYMRSVPGKLDVLELTRPLPCGNGLVPAGYQWNGASSGILRNLPIVNFPKWKHPIATCRHDWRCAHTKTKKQRKIADQMFRADVGQGGTRWEQIKGYLGVRLGALFGVGS
ncbi:MAG: hypothetical protein L3J57_01715 [Desulfuromusa sp.]|nr:hypothetical protein [Desulfuromusa sp.]